MEEQKVSDNEIDKFIDKWKDYTPEQQKKNVESNENFFPQIIKAMGPTNSRIDEIWANTSIDIQTSKILQMTELLKQNTTTLLAVWEQTHSKVKDEKMIEVISAFGNDSTMAIDLWERVPADLQVKEMPAILNSGMSHSLKMDLVKNSPVAVQKAVAKSTPELAKAYGISIETSSIYPIQTGAVVLGTVQEAKTFLRTATAEQKSTIFRENPDMVRDIFRNSNRYETQEIINNMSEKDLNDNLYNIIEAKIQKAESRLEEGDEQGAEDVKNSIKEVFNNEKLNKDGKEKALKQIRENYPEFYKDIVSNDAFTFEMMQEIEKSMIDAENKDENGKMSQMMINKFLTGKLPEEDLDKLGFEKNKSGKMVYKGNFEELFKKFEEIPELKDKIVNLEQSEELLLNMPEIYKNWDRIYENIILERLYQNGQLGGEKVQITAEQTLKTWRQMSEENSENEVDYKNVNKDLVFGMMDKLSKVNEKNEEYKKQIYTWGAISSPTSSFVKEAYNIDLDELAEKRAREEVMKEFSGDEDIEMIEEKIAKKKANSNFRRKIIKREIVGEISEEDIEQEALYDKEGLDREKLIDKVYDRKFSAIMAENAKLAMEYYRSQDKTELYEKLEAHKDELWRQEEKEESQEISTSEEGKNLFDDLCSDDKTKTTDVQKGKNALETAKEITKQNMQEQEVADDVTQNDEQEGIGIDD